MAEDPREGVGGRSLLDAGVPERVIEVPTPSGLARAHLFGADASARAAVVLGHGAGGGIAAHDLLAVRDVALAESIATVLVEQPYRVAAKRSPAPAHQLDAAWRSVLATLRAGPLRDLRLITGGRSAGARVACRTAGETSAAAVLCLAFPLLPPRRASDRTPRPSRLDELDAVRVRVLVVQGTGDPFGMPPARRGRTVAQVPGNHSLRTDLDAVRTAVRTWLRRVA